MNRREFLAASAGMAYWGTVSGSGPEVAAAEEKSRVFPIVDTHQHLWGLKKFTLPWLAKNESLKNDYLPKDYADATAKLCTFKVGGQSLPGKIVKAVYMEVDVDPSQQAQEAEYVIGLCKSGETPTTAAVISGRPASDDFKKYVTAYKDNKYVKGLRQVLHGDGTPKGYCLDDKFVKGVQLLGELGMSYDICIRPGELLDGAKLIDACPGTRFILDHCGNANVLAKDQSHWKKDIAEVAKRKKVVCKVSGIIASAKPGEWTAEQLAPIVKHVLDVFGPERVMFGGDWPVCTLTAPLNVWIETLYRIVRDRSEEQLRKLFHDNAVKFYGLA
jgi:predicted TIM-barrel fold metal-dependent hydrolase